MNHPIGHIKVSVIVPNYNHERFLRERLDSIYNQTFQDFEVILLDDASTDGSVEILREYAARPKTRIIVNKSNSGTPFRQWEKGFDLARGELVWFAESDDTAESSFLERLVPSFNDSGVGVAYCQVLLINEIGERFSEPLPRLSYFPRSKWASDFVGDGRAECADILFTACVPPTASCTLYRRNTINHAGGISRMKICGDYDLLARAHLVSDVAFVDAPLACWRRHSCAHSDPHGIRYLNQLVERWLVSRHIAHSLPLTTWQKSRGEAALAGSIANSLYQTGVSFRGAVFLSRLMFTDTHLFYRISRRLVHQLFA